MKPAGQLINISEFYRSSVSLVERAADMTIISATLYYAPLVLYGARN